jgi:hypothetical protein
MRDVVDMWYVSYRSNILPRREGEESRPVRATRKFATEIEARKFAEEVVAKGWSAIAATINPRKPRKMVPSTRILDWIAGEF